MSKKKASISFGVDTTKPNILISNIEGGKVYAQDGRTATVLVKDNLLLQSAKVYVNDNLIKFLKRLTFLWIRKMKLKAFM